MVRRLASLTPRVEWALVPLRVPAFAAVAGGAAVIVAGAPRSLLIGAVHFASAGMWGGGILVMAFLRPPDGWRGAEARLLIERFARVAVVAFVVTALTGVIQATDRLHDVSDLWTTPYGIVLFAKVMAVLLMGALSVAWRRGLAVARIDAAAVAVVVLITAVLAAIPQPQP